MHLGQQAIEDAYRTYAHSVLRRAQRLLGSAQEAQEVLHEVFVSLLERPEQYEEKSSILTYLYSATTHGCLNRLRAKNTRQRLLAEHYDAVVPGRDYCAPDREVELRDILKKLPDGLAVVAVYHYVDAMTYDEMAELLGCSRRKAFYLMEQLRQWVQFEESRHG